ncbi:MAG: redoxin domain-containing protein [Pseudomonadota bacterium]
MKKYYWMTMLLMVAMLGGNAQAQERVGDFTLIDHKGDPHYLSRYGWADALVIISHATGCQTNQENVARYKTVRTNFDHQNIAFVMINSDHEDNRETIRAEDAVWEWEFPIMIDRTQLVAEDLGIEQAGQVVVVEPSRGNILYRGPMDIDAEFEGGMQMGEGEGVFTLLEDLIAGEIDPRNAEPVIVDMEPAEGCALEFPARDRHMADVPDYETEVAPILIERCVGCHVEGGIGPFAMNSHQMVQGWSPMIREVIMTQRMPPMQVDPDVHNNSWYNSGNMPTEEKQTLIHWIEAGAPRE